MCADWQEFDGTTCICSNRCSANSDINMGIVCDDNGNRHSNLCEFTYKKCSGQVPITVNLVSCGKLHFVQPKTHCDKINRFATSATTSVQSRDFKHS